MDEELYISLGEYLKILLKRVWWALGAAAVVLVAAVCVVQFWYNPEHAVYKAEFELRLPDGQVYPDGATLRPDDSVRLDSLLAVKTERLLPENKRTGEFADVDIQTMVSEDAVKFAPVIRQLGDGTFLYANSIEISAKFFKNDKTAVDFLKATAEFPLNKALQTVSAMNYSERLAKYDSGTSYSEKMDALEEQKSYILSVYEKIKALYGGGYAPANLKTGKTIDQYILEAERIFGTSERQRMEREIDGYDYYFNAEDVLENIGMEIESVQAEIDMRQTLIDGQYEEMQKTLSLLPTEEAEKEIASFTDKIADYRLQSDALKERKKQLETTQENIRRYTDGVGKTAKDDFDSRLGQIRDDMEECTRTMSEVNIATYMEKAEVVYANNKIEAQGTLNPFLIAGLGALIGFLVAAGAIFIKETPEYRRKKLAEMQSAQGAVVQRTEDGANVFGKAESEASALEKAGNGPNVFKKASNGAAMQRTENGAIAQRDEDKAFALKKAENGPNVFEKTEDVATVQKTEDGAGTLEMGGAEVENVAGRTGRERAKRKRN